MVWMGNVAQQDFGGEIGFSRKKKSSFLLPELFSSSGNVASSGRCSNFH